MTAERLLVIILSSTLAVFLILGIVIAVLVVQILRHIKHITEKAESIADKAEAVSEFFERGVGPMAIGRLITNISEVIFKKSNKKSRSKGEDDA